MHQWRVKLEERYRIRNEEVNKHFIENEKIFEEHEIRVDKQDDINNKLFDDHEAYLIKLNSALAVTNNEIQRMQAQNEL